MKCKLCGIEKEHCVEICYDCITLTQAYHKWMRYIRDNRKEETPNTLIKGVGIMNNRLLEIGRKTLKEWDI